MPLVESLRRLVASVGSQHDRAVSCRAGVCDGVLDQRVRDATAPPRPVDIALRQIGAALLHASGAHQVARQRIRADVGQRVTDEVCPGLGNK